MKIRLYGSGLELCIGKLSESEYNVAIPGSELTSVKHGFFSVTVTSKDGDELTIYPGPLGVRSLSKKISKMITNQ